MPLLSYMQAANSGIVGTGGAPIEFDIDPLGSFTVEIANGGAFNIIIGIQGDAGMIYGTVNITGHDADAYHMQILQNTSGSYAVWNIVMNPPYITIQNQSSDTAFHVGILPILGGENLIIPNMPQWTPGATVSVKSERVECVLEPGKTAMIGYTNPTNDDYCYEFTAFMHGQTPAMIAVANNLPVIYASWFMGTENLPSDTVGLISVNYALNVWNDVVLSGVNADGRWGFKFNNTTNPYNIAIRPIYGRVPDIQII